MRTRLFVVPLLLVSILPAIGAAQGFHAVHSQDGVDVWAVGDSGMVYRSFDAGSTWTSRNLGNKRLAALVARGFRVLIAGDSGKVWRSEDSGGTWSLYVRAGAPALHALDMPSELVAYAVGASGTILKTEDGGTSWTSQFSGTSVTLHAVRFIDESNGWTVGANGTALRTGDGGVTWVPVATGMVQTLQSVDVLGSAVWMVGRKGVAVRSVDGGATFAPVRLALDHYADVMAVQLVAPDVVWLAGGGGFLRMSTDGGTTWSFPVHPMQGQIAALCLHGSGAWAVSNRNRVVIRSTNSGQSWSMAAGTTVVRSWIQKLPFVGNVRGSTFSLNHGDQKTLYCAMGSTVYRSRDDGEHWSMMATIPLTTKVNSFIVSPKDSNVMIAAVSGLTPKRLVKSDDHGQTWFTTLQHDFGEYGVPLDIDPDHPDTAYFGGDNAGLYRSTDGGKNWALISNNTFRSPCDIVVIPDSSNVIVVGDGVTGQGQAQYYKSTDSGHTFNLQVTRPFGASEIPGMANVRLRKETIFGTNWGLGGVQRSSDYGTTWPNVSSVGSAWGVGMSQDDPNCVIFGVFSGGLTYLSLDGGDSYTTIPITGSNYSFYARDRGLILAEQSNGVHKLNVVYSYTPDNTQQIALSSPGGGEVWVAGSVQDITWSTRNVAVVRIEYRREPGDPWQLVTDVPGYQGSFAWTVPFDSTSEAMIRVRDLWDGSPADSSALFTITLDTLVVDLITPNGGETWQYGTLQSITWSSNLSDVALEYQTEPGGVWKMIVPSVPASSSPYWWSIPFDTTSSARVRAREVSGARTDESSGVFRITAPVLVAQPNPLELPLTAVGQTRAGPLLLRNLGTAPLAISLVASDHPVFWPGRTSLVIMPGHADTVGVYYAPVEDGPDTAHVTITADDPFTPHEITVTGWGSSAVAAAAAAPGAFALWQNHPNPFQGGTRIRYALPSAAPVSLEVFDLQGHRVATLIREEQAPGVYSVPFAPGARSGAGGWVGPLPSGVYFYRLQAGPFTSTRKMLLLK